MRLFLSSEDFGNYPEALVELVGDNTKVAFINNAKDYYSAEDRREKTEEKKDGFHQLGFEVREFDLRAYFDKSKQLENDLEDYGLVWASGGNTFILRRAMAFSGLDKILQTRLAENSLAYGGSSAGSCITAPTLHGIEFGDRPDPSSVPKDYPSKQTIWEGLGLVPFTIVPHYRSTWFEKEADESIAYMKEHNIPHKILKDGQVVVVDGDKEEFLK